MLARAIVMQGVEAFAHRWRFLMRGVVQRGVYTALQIVHCTRGPSEHVCDRLDVTRLARVTRAQECDLARRIAEALDAASSRERQRLQRLQRAAGRRETALVPGGEQKPSLGIDDRNRTIVNAVDSVAARCARERHMWRSAAGRRVRHGDELSTRIVAVA